MTLIAHLVLLHLVTYVLYVKAVEIWAFWNDVDVVPSQQRKLHLFEDDGSAASNAFPESGLFLTMESVEPVVVMILDVLNVGIYFLHKAYSLENIIYTVRVSFPSFFSKICICIMVFFLKVMLALIVLGFVGKIMDGCTFFLICHLACFVGPLVYLKYQVQIDTLLTNTRKLFQKQIASKNGKVRPAIRSKTD